jgi:anti-anti-sigma factor
MHATAHQLDGELTIQQATAQQQALLEAVAACATHALMLDLSRIEACDSAGVQLLLATRLSLAQHGGTLQLDPVSAPVRAALHTYGLIDWLPAGELS